MEISLKNVKRSGIPKPTIDLIYAPQGMGKTTLAAGAPDPIFLQTEEGLGALEADTFGLLRGYQDVIAAIGELITKPHSFKTAILDSAGWLEPLIWDETCRINRWADIEAPGFNKGPTAAVNVWRVVLDGLSHLRDHLGMGVIILAHSEVQKIKPPDGEDYTRYSPKLHFLAAAKLQEYCDNVLFINTRASITRSVERDPKSRGIAVGGDKRYVYTDLKPTHMAKNRFRMPGMIPLPPAPAGEPPVPFDLFSAVYKYVPYYKALMEGAMPPATQATKLEVEDEQEMGFVENPFENLGADQGIEEKSETTENA